MAASGPENLENILNSFAEVMSMILLDLHQQHLAELDLTLPQAQVLRVLRRSGALATGRLAGELRISAPAVTQLTDRLIRKGLIERQTCHGDRRSVLVGLSVKGKRLIDQFRKRRSEIFSGALAQLDETERREVMASLGKVLRALEQYEAKLAIERGPAASKGERKQRVS